MQALYQLSYSPLRLRGEAAHFTVPPGFPGGDANITRFPWCTTKSFPVCTDSAPMSHFIGFAAP
ncbi:hypothetical protein [Streptomyces rhizosphaerihabitans]|uniref:hypothetical protein n=1 Tax=Streptomyces rhizosphaerihabitans TaxID=1266770 RepID=UPI0021C09274|nr:hypothetical protein [Streptomyces rhizosphaerihabitans]MCT9004253.1 hypothetical protein [Streptomyces rhizosphaerihabitans]